MRVLMTADAVGGVWTYAHALCRSFDDLGIDVTLAVMGPRPSRSQMAAFAPLRRVDIRLGDFALEWMDNPWRDVDRAGGWLRDLEASTSPDVIHLNGYAHAALPFRAPVLVAAHSCVCSWWRAVHRDDAPARYDRYRDAVRRGLRAATATVAPSRFMLRALVDHYGEARRANVIPNGLHPDRATVAEKQPVILSAGRLWDAAKNVSALDAIAPTLPWPVRIAGPTVAPGGQQHVSVHAGALGPLSARMMAREMALASIFALPARYEPFGLSVLEAALARCALVLGDIPSLRELWEGAALFVHPEDPDALASAIRTLIDDAGLRLTMASLAVQRARAYTAERMASAYLETYDTIREDAGAAQQVPARARPAVTPAFRPFA